MLCMKLENNMKIVFDTNILISVLLIPKSNAGNILKLWREEKFDLMISDFILAEMKKVLHYPKIKKRLQWEDEKINHSIDLFSFYAKHTDIKGISVEVAKDQNDAPILATYIAAQTDYLVTGDNDLLSLSKSYSIITPTEFLKILFFSYLIDLKELF